MSEYQIYESAGMDQAMSSASFSDNGEQFEDGYAESKAEPESSASGSVSASAAQPLLAALENARQVRIKLDGADITVTDPASIEQLRLFLEEQPADAEADVSAADTVGTVELVRTRGWRFPLPPIIQSCARTGNRPFPLRRKRPRWRRRCKNWTSDGLRIKTPALVAIGIQEGRQNAAPPVFITPAQPRAALHIRLRCPPRRPPPGFLHLK